MLVLSNPHAVNNRSRKAARPAVLGWIGSTPYQPRLGLDHAHPVAVGEDTQAGFDPSQSLDEHGMAHLMGRKQETLGQPVAPRRQARDLGDGRQDEGPMNRLEALEALDTRCGPRHHLFGAHPVHQVVTDVREDDVLRPGPGLER